MIKVFKTLSPKLEFFVLGMLPEAERMWRREAVGGERLWLSDVEGGRR